MSNYLSEDGTFINSLIGEGSSFNGDISLKGLLRIDGDFVGSIKDGGKVLIGKTGRAEAIISAGTVVVGGILKGNISADEKVVILSTGMVIGNVRTPRLMIEDGVIFHGNCTVSGKSADTTEKEPEKTGSSFLFSSGNRRELETVSSWKK